MRNGLAALLIVLGVSLAAPALAEEGGGGYQKIDNLIIEMWDKEGLFHTLVVQMQAWYPERPQMPKGLGARVSQKVRLIPYEELKKPDAPDRIKAIVREVLQEDPGSAKVEGIYIQKWIFQ